MFDTVASDPGSNLIAEAVELLIKWLGMGRKVSLVGRHESNGVESSGKQFIRLLKMYVNDKRLAHKWSDDLVLSLINHAMCSFPTRETGGITPW